MRGSKASCAASEARRPARGLDHLVALAPGQGCHLFGEALSAFEVTLQTAALPTLACMKRLAERDGGCHGVGMAQRARLADGLLTAGLLAWAASNVPWWWRPPGHSTSTPVVLGYIILMLAQSVPFLWWRRWPELAAGMAGAVLAIRAGLHQDLFSAAAATLVGAFGLGAWGSPVVRRMTRVLRVLALVGAGIVLVISHPPRVQALPLALLATALGLGEAMSVSRDAATASARVAHTAERARIARELHDVLAHQLSAIAVQAGAARVASENDPAVAAKVVGNIEAIAREGLIDLNRIVGALRRDENEQLDRHPQPRIGDLPDLIAGARLAGLPVELAVTGQAQNLPATVELAAYRVVQESLTNALRYAGPATTRVSLTYMPDGLDLTVEDDGPAADSTARSDGSDSSQQNGGGRGLAGLSERAQILGGSFEAGPRSAGGFSVHAWLPVPQ